MVEKGLAHGQEEHQGEQARSPTIVGEGMETPRFKVLEQKFRAQERCHPGYTHPKEYQHKRRGGQTSELGNFEDRGCSNERRSQQKGVARGVLMGEAYSKASDN